MAGIGFDNKSTSRSLRRPEFQAVILAGYGANLQPLTNELTRANSSTPTPKALLPIANKPIISYPLTWLQDAGVKDVLIIAPASHKAELSENIWDSDASSPSFSSMAISLETIDDTECASLGTADVLRRFSNLIQTDFIVLPCDFIPPPSLTLSSLLNSYRIEIDQPIISALLYERGDSLKDGPSAVMFGIDKKTNTMIYADEDFETDEDLDLRMSLLWKYPHTSLTSRYLDSHVYIIKRTVLDLINLRPNLSSLKEEVIPWLCKLPYRTSQRARYGSAIQLPTDPQSLALAHSTTPYPTKIAQNLDFQVFSPDPHASPQPFSRTNVMMQQSLMSNTDSPKIRLEVISSPAIRCGVVLHHLKDGYAARANSIGAYFELNRQALARAAATAELTPSNEGRSQQVSIDSIVSASTRIGERTSIKKSVLGPHCVIGKNVKISGCVIMDHVVVKDGAKLENSILSRNTVVEERAQLKDCELAPGYTTQPDVTLKGERLTVWQAY